MKLKLLAAALFAIVAEASPALVLSFDTGILTAGSGAPLGTGITLNYAVLETEDEFGDALPQPVWRPDGSAPAVTADSTLAFNHGAPASAPNALNALDSPVLFTFDSAVTLSGFSTVLDNSAFGNLTPQRIEFYDSADGLIGFISIDQTVPGLTAQSAGGFAAVKTIVLPSGAFYDNVTLNPAVIPEPAVFTLAALPLGALLLRRRRSVSQR